MKRQAWISSAILLFTITGTGLGLTVWKHKSIQRAAAAAAQQPEPMESVTVGVATEREYRPTTTSIGTVLALRSITLRNELPGTVRQVALTPGLVVTQGMVLVALDVSVEQAELKAQETQAALAETLLARLQKALETRSASEAEVDRARAEVDVARAQMLRTQAIIDRKTIRAPFPARVGMADVHPGQFLEEGTQLTTLQGLDDAVHVDFTVPQRVAAGLREGENVTVLTGADATPIPSRIVAIDARIDPNTRNAMVRARIEGAAQSPSPGASVRVRTPMGPPTKAVAIPVSALRKGPGGDHVFVIAPAKDGKLRAQLRPVLSGTMINDEVLIQSGLVAGEQVAVSGSFKLRDAVLVAIAEPAPARALGAQ